MPHLFDAGRILQQGLEQSPYFYAPSSDPPLSVDHPPADNAQHEAAVLRSMVLLATFATASQVWKKIAARRAGQDPSGQEPAAVVRPRLAEAGREVDALILQLRRSWLYIAHQPEERLPALVRRFELLMMLNRLAGRLHLIHQWLLSLYPEVSEALVEAVRGLRDRAAALQEMGADQLPQYLDAFLDEARDFNIRMQQEAAA